MLTESSFSFRDCMHVGYLRYVGILQKYLHILFSKATVKQLVSYASF